MKQNTSKKMLLVIEAFIVMSLIVLGMVSSVALAGAPCGTPQTGPCATPTPRIPLAPYSTTRTACPSAPSPLAATTSGPPQSGHKPHALIVGSC